MAADTPRRPLWNGQFVWLSSKKDGSLRVIFGPDPLETTEDDLWLVQDQESTKMRVVSSPVEAIRDFITLQVNQFAILTNPANNTDGYPNGSWARGRKELVNLNHGSTRVIAQGHFPLWPGQVVTVKNVYRLSPSEYLIAQVVSENVDSTAPYYEVTVRCAADISAVVDDAVESNSPKSSVSAGAGQQEEDKGEKKSGGEKKSIFQVGQRIRISGTPNYIPPTGVEIVPDASGKEIRQALVLGPTEFCGLIDRDGQPQRKSGPGRVFPGPYDLVQTNGSRGNGIYDAYHLRDDRGLLIRVVADKIPKAELAKQLPSGVVLEKDSYGKGDEIFIKGISAYLVPGNAIEVIDPETRLPQLGNDHSKIFVKAIGVDQKSGIYVSDVKTGNVELVRGEKSEVLDPRHKKHVKRWIPNRIWNLMIGHGEPHKKVLDERSSREREPMVETPWAISITVPNNEAILVTSREGRRCVVGPRTELLSYDETLQVLGLSRGKPKSDRDIKETCFLRVDGNSVSDSIRLQTKDYVVVEVEVSYGLRFIGETDEERAKWFNYTNYVQFFCDHLRSVLRAEARKLTLSDLIGKVAEFVRDTVLGVKPEEGHRTGRKFEENNMLVYEVEVLTWGIPDAQVAKKIDDTNLSVVNRQLEEANKRNQLESQRTLDGIDAESKEIAQGAIEREKKLALARVDFNNVVNCRQHEVDFALQQRQQEDALALQRNQSDVEDELSKRKLIREKGEADQEVAIDRAKNEVKEVHAKANSSLVLQELAATAEADVKRLAAVQPGLVEAIVGASNANLASEMARNLPKASGGTLNMLLGAGGVRALKQFVKGTNLEAALAALEGGAPQEGSKEE